MYLGFWELRLEETHKCPVSRSPGTRGTLVVRGEFGGLGRGYGSFSLTPGQQRQGLRMLCGNAMVVLPGILILVSGSALTPGQLRQGLNCFARVPGFLISGSISLTSGQQRQGLRMFWRLL